jgi:hypothetical protein
MPRGAGILIRTRRLSEDGGATVRMKETVEIKE